jgi:hypothetical protein
MVVVWLVDEHAIRLGLAKTAVCMDLLKSSFMIVIGSATIPSCTFTWESELGFLLAEAMDQKAHHCPDLAL